MSKEIFLEVDLADSLEIVVFLEVALEMMNRKVETVEKQMDISIIERLKHNFETQIKDQCTQQEILDAENENNL